MKPVRVDGSSVMFIPSRRWGNPEIFGSGIRFEIGIVVKDSLSRCVVFQGDLQARDVNRTMSLYEKSALLTLDQTLCGDQIYVSQQAI